jgi:predicted SprT family Zn-dependent metalloprotease
MTQIALTTSTLSHREMIDRRLDELMQKAVELKMPITRPKVVYDLAGTAAGYYVYDKHTIRVNEILLKLNLSDYVHQTFGHEFVHAVVHYHYPHAKSHGWEWKHVMLRFGLEPSTTHRYDTTLSRVRRNRKIDVLCGCGIRPMSIIKYNRMVLKGRTYVCRHCGERVKKKEPM